MLQEHCRCPCFLELDLRGWQVYLHATAVDKRRQRHVPRIHRPETQDADLPRLSGPGSECAELL